MAWVALVLATFCAVMTVVHLASAGIGIARGWRAPRALPRRAQPPVSVIRPVCGLGEEERATLASSFDLDPRRVEVLFCCRTEEDAAIPEIRRLMHNHPGFPAQVLVGDHLGTANPKLNNMAKGWWAARHRWVLFADSNLLLPSDYVERLLARWRHDTGVVCVPPIGVAPRGFAAELECAFLNTCQARWQLTVDALGLAFAQGKTMLFRSEDIEHFGGIGALGAELAEDAAATKLVRQAGLKVCLADPVFGQPLGQRTLADVLGRQLRWAQLRRATFPGFYVPEALGGCLLPIAAGALAAALLGAPALLVLIGLFAVWLGAEAALAAAWGWPLSWRAPLAWLARDMLLPVIWVYGWVAQGYEWRGNAVQTHPVPARGRVLPFGVVRRSG